MSEPKKLIEVAMPIKEISAESVRDKSIRHGHISTLHLWWARRPLPVCRAVVFASLVPDPLDENCPKAFKDAIEILLAPKNNFSNSYGTYADIPWTSVFDPMEDNLRNRLQMFIGKFSNEMQQHLLGKAKKPQVLNVLSDLSLIKWDNKNNEEIINIARKLIWVAFNSIKGSATASELISDFEKHLIEIKDAESMLYSVEDRHIESEISNKLRQNLNNAIESFLEKMPRVFDPFAGGGAIPLEAARLGCRSFGNDINPVAHIIQKASLEFPQKFGKPIVISKDEFIRLYGIDEFNLINPSNRVYNNGDTIAIRLTNRLSFDVRFFANKLLRDAESEIGKYYPKNEKNEKPIAYYWVKVGSCSNPTCNAEVPLLKQFYLCNTPTKKVYLEPKITNQKIDFEIKEGVFEENGWLKRGNLHCPVCGNTTDVKTLKKQFISGKDSERILAVIWGSKNGKMYRKPTEEEISLHKLTPEILDVPTEKMPVEYTQALPSCTWGISTWGEMFSKRQLNVILTLVQKLNTIKNNELNLDLEYNKAIVTYLAILIDRIAIINTRFGRYHTGKESLEHPFSKQAIPMIFDYPESNPFCYSSGSAMNQLDWIIRYIESESISPFYSFCNNSSSGDKSQFKDKYITAVITDPPYYDAIAYADLSDFFYVWLKRTIGDVYPLNFATPQTPKTDECTALKHHHLNKDDAKLHFENKLTQIFDAIEHQTSDIVSIMFAHQSTEAWTTLCNSILDSRMNITGSWAIDTEMANRSIGLAGAALESSVTVSCRPSQRSGNCDFIDVKKAVELKVEKEVELLYSLGFRGADLLTACFGHAVSEFGKFSKIEKKDGSLVSVADLLELARESAFNSLLKGFKGDDYTKFYIGWLQLNGFAEGDNDDAAKFTKVGLSIDVQDLYKENILIKAGNNQHLADLKERISKNNRLGESKNCAIIDVVHKMMYLYSSNNRSNLLKYIENNSSDTESPNWRVLTSLAELLPKNIEDHKLAVGLLTNKDQLIREAKSSNTPKPEQSKLTFE